MTENTHQRWWHVDALFSEALDLDPSNQDAFLKEACQGDTALRREVETLLKAHHDAQDQDLLGQPLLGQPMPLLPPDLEHPSADRPDPPGHTDRPIGAYRLLGQIGRGGMGSVYLAERNDGHFRQRVALKLLRRSALSPEAIDRFRLERQILARLEHPGIALLLDGGVTDEGLPYLVMQYVDGVPIDQYCDEHRLSIEERLKLFLQVCQAVQYAHQSLVVHRDLKPSNILVTAKGQVKLLDFGIAKVIGAVEDGEPTLLETQPGRGLMTPAYASPEQVRGEAITTASDVYALGVLLYELLTGRRPYRVPSPVRHEIERVILEQEPVRPSVAVRSGPETAHEEEDKAATLEVLSQARSTRPERLERRLQGDLDNIILKALEKESARRYGSAEQLAEDLSRHLSGLPVKAQAGTLGYRMGKFVGRHRVALSVAASVVVLLAVVVGFYTLRLAQERDRAQSEASKLSAVEEYLVGLFEVSDPWEETNGADVTAGELLDRGLARIEELGEEPEVQATMLEVLGVVHRRLGLYEEAEPLLERSLTLRQSVFGEEHIEIATSMSELSALLHDTGDYEESERLDRAVLQMRRKLLGEEHLDVAEGMSSLASVLSETAAYDEAEQLLRTALALYQKLVGEEHLDVAESMSILANVLEEKGSYDEAERLHRDALALRRKLRGDEHPEIAISLNNLATVLEQKGSYDEAERLHRETLALRRKLLGEEHPFVARSLSNLGTALYYKGSYDEAEQLLRDALAMRRKLLDEEHPEIGENMDNLAIVLSAEGYNEEAEELHREALALERKRLGEEHPQVANSMGNLAALLFTKGSFDEAEQLLRDALRIERNALGQEHPNIATSLNNLATVLFYRGSYKEAEELLRETLALRRKLLGEEHPNVAISLNNLAQLFSVQGKHREAAQHYQESSATLRKIHPEGHWHIAVALVGWSWSLIELGQGQETDPLLREAIALFEAAFGPEDWRTAEAQAARGASLAAQERYEEAEALLKQGYAILQEKRGTSRRPTQRALQALVDLYEVWGKPDMAAPYRALLTK